MFLYHVFAGVDSFLACLPINMVKSYHSLPSWKTGKRLVKNYYIKKSIDLISPNCGGPFIGELVQLSEPQFLQWQNKGSKLYFSLRFVSATVLYKCKSMQNLVNCFVPYSPDF